MWAGSLSAGPGRHLQHAVPSPDWGRQWEPHRHPRLRPGARVSYSHSKQSSAMKPGPVGGGPWVEKGREGRRVSGRYCLLAA
ncbi:hypothetical protein BJV78DRAFT_96404 [Lactifluus subvellereus]|nr:hypothetical protein BJV78DRAFT_96404 [Lactifluus subvellereus]